MNKEFENYMIEKERAKSDHDRYLRFEYNLRYLFCELQDEIDEEDRFLLDDIKQAIIVFAMKDRFEELNEIFLSNMKNDFYSAIEKLEERHEDIKSRTRLIKLFMEDFYFIK